jgi:hypothetical protein
MTSMVDARHLRTCFETLRPAAGPTAKILRAKELEAV